MSNILRTAPVVSDKKGRSPGYLRLSITDRCNFNCIYCGDTARRQYIPHEHVLRYEEMLRFARQARKLGTGKIRVTGGEPFVRKGCMEFLASLRMQFPEMILSATTNGSLLEPHIAELAKLGLASMNISLDTFDRETFKRITGRDVLPDVLNNIDRLLAAGLRVKLNAVAMRGVTDRQAADFIHAIGAMPVDMRFIEFMPMGGSALWDESVALRSEELLRIFNRHATLRPSADRETGYAGPARMYDVAGKKGRLGFISAISNHFCASCNRLRLTCDGQMRLCLFGTKEYRLAPMLRRVSDRAVGHAIAVAWGRKPMGCDILRKLDGRSASGRHMAAIGG